MGWLADWLWCAASKNRLRALFLILSQSLCFSQNYWCMSGLEKQRGNIKSAFEVQGFVLFCQTTTKRFHQNPDWYTAVIWRRWTIFVGVCPDDILIDQMGKTHAVLLILRSVLITHFLYRCWKSWAVLTLLPGWTAVFARVRFVFVILIHNQSKSISGVQPEHTHPHSHPPPFLSHTPPTCMYVALYFPLPLLL